METNDAISALAALAQPTRLAAYRLLVVAEPEGLAAGELARLLRVPANTLSGHASVLARAGLIAGERDSRSVVFRALPARVSELADFLTTGCCGGRPEKCLPEGAHMPQIPNTNGKPASHE